MENSNIVKFLLTTYRRISSDKLLNNVFWNFLARFSSAGINFVTSILLMSILSVRDYGDFVFFFSIYSTIPFIFDLGLNNSFVSMGAKLYSENKIEYLKVASTAFTIKLFTLLLVSVLTIFAITYGVIEHSLAIVIIFGAILGIWEYFVTVFKANQSFKLLSRVLPFRNLLALTGIILFHYTLDIKSWSSYLNWIMAVPLLMCLVVYFGYLKDIRVWSNLFELKRLLYSSKWISLFTIITALHARADIYLLEYFASSNTIKESEVGVFSAAVSLLAVLNLATSSFSEAILPRLSQESNQEYFSAMITRLKKATPSVLLLAITVGMLLTFGFRFGFDKKYTESIDCLVFIGAGMVFQFYLHTISTMFYPLKRTDIIFKTVLLMFMTNLVIGYFVIPILGSLGAAIGNLVVSIIGFGHAALSIHNILAKQKHV